MIIFDKVSKIYTDNNSIALENVSFHIEKGEFVFLVGQSGAGKSSIIKMLLAEQFPTDGEVIINSYNLRRMVRSEIPYLRRSLGVVFQDFRLLAGKNVYDNVAFAMQIVGAPRRQIRRRVPDVLSMVGLAHKAKAFPRQLSGGEQQRVSMARALANNPSVLVADEPTGNLDSEMARDIVSLLEDINMRGTTIVMATHAEKIVNDMRKRVLQLENGILVRDEKKGVYSYGV